MNFRVRASKTIASGGVLLAACGAPGADDYGTTLQSITIDSNATYRIVGVESNKCVQIEGASTADLARAEIGACNGSTAQGFRITPVANAAGFFSIRNVNSGRCLDVEGVSTAEGARLIQWTCSSGRNQQWSISDVSSGVVRLTARHSNKIVEVSAGATADGSDLFQRTWAGRVNQQFRLEIPGSGGAGGQGGSSGASGSSTGGMAGTGMGGTAGAGGSGGAAPGCGNAAAPKGAQNLTIQVDGKARTYLLFVPNGYDANKSIPLIFAWHSSGATGAESRKYYNLEPTTGDGAIIVYPNGLNGGWDLAANGVDMKFFDALLESISKDYCVDQKRVFSTGYSFGGMMSHSLACSRGSKLRGFAPMAGALFGGANSCATPVPAWIAHATNDNVVSYASGQAAKDIWLKTNGCGTTTTPTTPSPCVAYECSKAPVQWCVHNDGHVWPKFASKGVWDFFKSL